jgi:hypothetical protein
MASVRRDQTLIAWRPKAVKPPNVADSVKTTLNSLPVYAKSEHFGEWLSTREYNSGVV